MRSSVLNMEQIFDATSYDEEDPDWLFPFGEVPSAFSISRSSIDGVNLTVNGESREVQCTPWAEAFGFFFGDGTQQDDGVIMSITEVNHGDSLTENFLLGETRPPCSTGQVSNKYFEKSSQPTFLPPPFF